MHRVVLTWDFTCCPSSCTAKQIFICFGWILNETPKVSYDFSDLETHRKRLVWAWAKNFSPPKSETLTLWTQLISPKLWHFFWTNWNYLLTKIRPNTSIAQHCSTTKTFGPAFLKSQEYIASQEDSHQHGGGWDFYQLAIIPKGKRKGWSSILPTPNLQRPLEL